MNAAAPKPPPPSYPAATIASLLMLTPRRVQQLAKDGVIPKDGHGRYQLAPAVQGYIRFLQERQITGSAPRGQALDYHAEKARLVKAQADVAEIAAERARGESLPASEVKAAGLAVVAEVRANLLGSVPGRIAARVRGVTDETALKRAVKDELVLALRALADLSATDILPAAEEEDGEGALRAGRP